MQARENLTIYTIIVQMDDFFKTVADESKMKLESSILQGDSGQNLAETKRNCEFFEKVRRNPLSFDRFHSKIELEFDKIWRLTREGWNK